MADKKPKVKAKLPKVTKEQMKAAKMLSQKKWLPSN